MGHTLLQVLQRIFQLTEKVHMGYQVSPQAIPMGDFSRLD